MVGKKGQIPWNKGLKGVGTGPKKGTKLTEAHKKEISKIWKGKNRPPFSDKWKKNLSKAHKGQKKSPKAYSFPSGSEHPNWKGGNYSLSYRLRRTSKWKIWRELVFLRDNFTCQNPDCKYCNNKIGVLLHPHHIKPVSLFPELVFRVDNGITYCAEFHLKSGLHIQNKLKQEVT